MRRTGAPFGRVIAVWRRGVPVDVRRIELCSRAAGGPSSHLVQNVATRLGAFAVDHTGIRRTAAPLADARSNRMVSFPLLKDQRGEEAEQDVPDIAHEGQAAAPVHQQEG
jgi:hypothetical protein